MNTTLRNHMRMTRYLQLISLVAVVLYFGRPVFVPLSYGLFIAIVLYPLCKMLENKGVPRSIAITASLIIIVMLAACLLVLLIMELKSFQKELSVLSAKINLLIIKIQQLLADKWNISLASQQDWSVNMLNRVAASAGTIISGTFIATGNALFSILMSVVFAVLFLFNRQVFVQFLETVAGPDNVQPLRTMLAGTISTYNQFIKGMAMVYLIVGILNSIGLLALGIPHAVLFGMLTAVMTIIPYAGIVISSLLPIAVAWITKDSLLYPLGVVMVFAVVQYLEANIIFPRVVAARLNVSTWATLVALLAGGLLWGVAGMILFIPFTGILKIVTGNMPGYKALNILLSR